MTKKKFCGECFEMGGGRFRKHPEKTVVACPKCHKKPVRLSYYGTIPPDKDRAAYDQAAKEDFENIYSDEFWDKVRDGNY